ncbi:MAG: hypothetical protein GKR91_04920 [Pseudomonadales bacterium]|nr:hypothetical protein [Pseudomonadales bacterium]
MDISKLNEWFTLTANLGVIAGIIFLGFEIQQNTEMMQAQTRDSMSEKQMDWFMGIATNLDTAEIHNTFQREGLNNPEREPFEEMAFIFTIFAGLRMWENEWYQYQKGLYEEEEFLARSRAWPGALRQTGYSQVWEDVRLQYAPEFGEYLDAILNDDQSLNQN